MKLLPLTAITAALVTCGACGYVAGASAPATSAQARAAATASYPVPPGCSAATGGYYTIRTYNETATGPYARTGGHGWGGHIKCITVWFGDAKGVQYVKTEVLNPPGGYLTPANGLDLTIVNCALPGYTWPAPNDCGWQSGTDENSWSGHPSSTP
jgi:hypothetical protein